MRPSRLLVPAVAAATAATLLAVPATADAAGKRPAVHLSVGRHQVVSAPSSTQPGSVRFVDSSRHAVVVLQAVNKHATAAQIAKVLGAQSSFTSARFRRAVKLLAIVNPRGDAYTRIRRGEVFVVSSDISRITAKSLTLITVRGAKRDAAQPSAPVAFVGRNDQLTVPARLRPGQYVRYRSDTTAFTLLLPFYVGSGTSPAELSNFLAHPTMNGLEQLDVQPSNLASFTPTSGSYVARFFTRRGRWLVWAIDIKHQDRLAKGEIREVVVG